jgi:F1F0 ATPase subunit 2
MNDTLTLLLAGSSGIALGAVFFGGLWWTVRRGVASPRPALWFLGSALLRTVLVVTGFYLVGGGQWRRLAACLAGFILARLAVTWLTRPSRNDQDPPSGQVARAPVGAGTGAAVNGKGQIQEARHAP